MKTPEELWTEYAQMVYPRGMEKIQAQETRQAFFAGLLDAVHELMKVSAEDGGGDLAVKQLDVFYKQVQVDILASVAPSGAAS